MNYETYQIMLYVLSLLAVIVFVALYFVKAGYGMFRTRSWGWSVSNKVGWVLMEAPSFVVMGLWAWKAGVEAYTPQAVFVGLFMLHYFQRSFVFPLLMKGKSRMPLAIMAMGILFNVINATLLAASFFSCALPGKYESATFWTNPLPWVGVVIFFIGMAINLHADHVIRNLRKPGDTRHYLPEKGFYRYVTSANYFGELVEWTGFALLTLRLRSGCLCGGQQPTWCRVPMPFTNAIVRSSESRRWETEKELYLIYIRERRKDGFTFIYSGYFGTVDTA